MSPGTDGCVLGPGNSDLGGAEMVLNSREKGIYL